jgi:hypothetical protein
MYIDIYIDITLQRHTHTLQGLGILDESYTCTLVCMLSIYKLIYISQPQDTPDSVLAYSMSLYDTSISGAEPPGIMNFRLSRLRTTHIASWIDRSFSYIYIYVYIYNTHTHTHTHTHIIYIRTTTSIGSSDRSPICLYQCTL